MDIPGIRSERLNGTPARVPIIGGVLVLCIVLAGSAAPESLTLVLLGALGIAVVSLILKNPSIGLMLLIPVSIFVNFGLTAGNNAHVGANLLLLGMLATLWLAEGAFKGFGDVLPRSRPVIPSLMLCAVAVLALVFGQLPWISFGSRAPLNAQLGGLATFVISAVVFLLTASRIRILAGLKWMTWIFLAVGALVVASTILRGPLTSIQRLIAAGSTGSLFWTWLAAMGFSQVVGNSSLHRGVKIGLLLVVFGIFQINFLASSSWVSGWLPPLVAIVAIAWARSFKLGLGLTLAGLAVAIGGLQERVARIVLANQYSMATRLEAWRLIGGIIRVNPVFGLGPANYYWYAPLVPILGYSVQFSSHNNYVDIVAQTGLLGLMAFMWFAAAIFLLARRQLSVADRGFERAYILGIAGGLSGTLVAGMLGDWVIPFVYNIGLKGMRASLLGWLFLGGLVALEQIQARSTNDVSAVI